LRGLREPTKIRASRVLLSADSDLWNSEKKAPPTKRGQGTAVRGLLGGEFPAPRAGPQIAYVELVPWSVRSRTTTGAGGHLTAPPPARSDWAGLLTRKEWPPARLPGGAGRTKKAAAAGGKKNRAWGVPASQGNPLPATPAEPSAGRPAAHEFSHPSGRTAADLIVCANSRSKR